MKTVSLLLALTLLIGLACQTKKGSETADSTTTTTLSSAPPPCSATVVLTTSNSYTVTFNEAYKLYEKFKEKSIKGKTGTPFCPRFKLLKCGVFPKGDLCHHLFIDETKLQNIAYGTQSPPAYNAFRLYPCLNGSKVYYLFTFAKKRPSTTPDTFDDIPGAPIVLVEVELQDQLCAIGPSLILGSHRLCVPNCPGNDDLLFDY